MTWPPHFTEKTENFRFQMGIPSISYHQTSSCLHRSHFLFFRLWLRCNSGFQTQLAWGQYFWDHWLAVVESLSQCNLLLAVLVLLSMWTNLVWDWIPLFFHAARTEWNSEFWRWISHVPGSPALESPGVLIRNEDFLYVPHSLLGVPPKILQFNNLPIEELFVYTKVWRATEIDHS